MAADLWTDALLIDTPAGGGLNGAPWEGSPQIVRTLLSCEVGICNKKKKKTEERRTRRGLEWMAGGEVMSASVLMFESSRLCLMFCSRRERRGERGETRKLFFFIHRS